MLIFDVIIDDFIDVSLSFISIFISSMIDYAVV